MSAEYTLSRRRLISLAAGAAGAAALGTRLPAAFAVEGKLLMPRRKTGIQLYTVRDQVSSLGFAVVLETLAKIGYREIEFAGYTQGRVGPITVAEIRALLDANGLVGIGSHVSPNDGNIEQILDDAEVLGLPYVGVSFNVPSSTSTAGWQQLADDYNRFGAAAAERGIRFYWHNHFQEFAFTEQPGVRGIDVLLAETDPNLVFVEYDIYWAHVGQYQFGQTPPFTFEPIDYPIAARSRYPLFHVKDGKRNPANPFGYDIVDVGDGDIDFRTFFNTVGGRDRHHYLMERDNASEHPEGSFASARESFAYMRRLKG